MRVKQQENANSLLCKSFFNSISGLLFLYFFFICGFGYVMTPSQGRAALQLTKLILTLK